MKKLITIILTSFIVSNAVGQEYNGTVNGVVTKLPGITIIDTNDLSPSITAIRPSWYEPKDLGKDTIIVWILVTDSGIVKSITGYSVREKYCCINGYTGTYAIYRPEPYYQHLEYLDEKKKPLSKNIIVWQSINQK